MSPADANCSNEDKFANHNDDKKETNLSVILVSKPHKVIISLPLEQLQEDGRGVRRCEPVEHVEGVEDGGDAGVVPGVHVQQLRLFLQHVVDHLSLLLDEEGKVLQHLFDEGSALEP